MKRTVIQRLISLNLTLVMLLSLLPVPMGATDTELAADQPQAEEAAEILTDTTQEESILIQEEEESFEDPAALADSASAYSYYYDYIYDYNRFFYPGDPRPTSSLSYLSLGRYASSSGFYGYSHCGWSLAPDGLPITDESLVPEPIDDDVYLYACWCQEIGVICHSFSDTYDIGPIQIGDTFIGSEDVMTTTPIEGTGWSYALGELTLTEDYPGDPIVAGVDLILHVEGDVTVRGVNGPAITAKNSIHFCSSEDGFLHLYGGTNSPAVSTTINIRVESPLNLEMIGDNCSALNSEFLNIGRMNYQNLASNRFLCNRLYSGSCAEDAVLQPLFPAYVHNPNPQPPSDDDHISSFSDLSVYAANVTDYSGNYLRFEAVDPDSVNFTIHMDPQGGSVAGLPADEVYQLAIPYADAKVTTSYSSSTATLTFPELPVPVREGYLFLGWNSGPAHYPGNYYTTGSELSLTAQMEDSLYAIWQKLPDSGYVILDGNGRTMTSGSFDTSDSYPYYILSLSDSQITLPDLRTSAFAGWSTTPDEPFAFWTEGLMQPGDTVEMTSGTTLYAVYAEHGTPYKIYGNGYTTPDGNSFIQVGEKAYQVLVPGASHSDLVTYYDPYTSKDLQQAHIFSAPDSALLDFGYSASTSSFYYEADYNYYAQWADAPSGSILLYSDGTATADKRYGKVIPPAEVASFSLSDDAGFQRAGHDLAGWSTDGSTILTQLPAPDEAGHIILTAVFTPRTLTYNNNGSVTSKPVSESGKITIADSPSVPSEKIFNGWNTQADGSGEWYLPSDVVTLEQSLTLYAQYLDIPADGNWVLFKDPDGPSLYMQQCFDSVDENGNVSALFPISVKSWANTADAKKYNYYGYNGGEQYLIPNHSTFTTEISGYQFHGNGGLYPGSYPLQIKRVYTSGSSLIAFPEQSDFEQIPFGMILGGWSADQVLTPFSTIYEPGKKLSFSYGSGNSTIPKVLYAVWDEADAVYVELTFSDTDGDRKETFTQRQKVGQTITLPAPGHRLGYQFTGWSDGTSTYPAGSDYTVPGADTTLNAQWEQLTGLIVDGVTYDASVAHDYSNGGTSGWKYTPSSGWNSLYLYNYNGGAIYVPEDTDIYLVGDNVITAADQTSALSGGDYIDIADDYSTDGYGTLTATGGSGAPAVTAYNLRLNQRTTVTLTGGSGAPAASVSYEVSLDSAHATLTGGSEMPAIQTSSTWANGLYFSTSNVHCFAGEDSTSGVELTDSDEYKTQHCVYTAPIYITVTLDADGGKVNGRGSWSYTIEKGMTLPLREIIPTRSNGKFLHWVDENGRQQYGGTSFQEDSVLTAVWDVSPYESYLYFECWNNYLVNGQKNGYLELPESGTIQLPVPEPNPDSNQVRYLYGWSLRDHEDNHVMTLPTTPLPVELFKSGYTITPSSDMTKRNVLWLVDPNGQLEKDEWAVRRTTTDNSLMLERWYGRENPYGYVLDSWNTKPDGSGTRYAHESTYTFDSDPTTPDILYAQWKEPFTYTTVKANEKLPGHTNQSRNYARTADGKWLADFLFWRTADGTRFYEPGSACDLPARTTLYGYFGNLNQKAAIRTEGNGAVDPIAVQFTQTWNNNDDGNKFYSSLESVSYTRKGYVLTGWNTKADGSGTQYAVDHRFLVGTINSNDEWITDDKLCAKLPDVLYAQWEKLPEAEIPVPLDMAQSENSQIYLATYSENGRMRSLTAVESGILTVVLYELPRDAKTYQFLCLSDDGTLQPVADSEPGDLP